MSKLLVASASVLVLALGAAGVQAYQGGPGMVSGTHGHIGQGAMAGQARGPHMMGGMMGSGMMLVMMDTDGDGSVSADEFQALHARMFNYRDANGDGKLDADELSTFHAERVSDANE